MALLTYQFAETFRCKELIFATKMFIHSNFTDVAETEEFLNLSSEEVKMWISSDEINVSAEEDVFKIILTWIDREKSERKKYFPELFPEVRVVYVSRDFLHNDVVTNDLVNDNQRCTDLVKDAVKLFETGFHYLNSAMPRKSLETYVIAFYLNGFHSQNNRSVLFCYFPQVEKWSRFALPPALKPDRGIVPCRDNLHFFTMTTLIVYDSFSDCWTAFPRGLKPQASFS